MPTLQMLKMFGVALCIVAMLVAGVLWWNKGAHLALEGSIIKVRTLSLEDSASAAFLDFRFVNPADYLYVVKEVTVVLIDPAGRQVDGETITEMDATRLFQYFPELGQKFNPSLLARERVAPKQKLDRMISARFNVPEAVLRARQNLILRVRETDGVVTEIRER